MEKQEFFTRAAQFQDEYKRLNKEGLIAATSSYIHVTAAVFKKLFSAGEATWTAEGRHYEGQAKVNGYAYLALFDKGGAVTAEEVVKAGIMPDEE